MPNGVYAAESFSHFGKQCVYCAYGPACVFVRFPFPDLACWCWFDVSGFIYTCPCQRHCEINWAKTLICLRLLKMSNQSLTCLTSKLAFFFFFFFFSLNPCAIERKYQGRAKLGCVSVCVWLSERGRQTKTERGRRDHGKVLQWKLITRLWERSVRLSALSEALWIHLFYSGNY